MPILSKSTRPSFHLEMQVPSEWVNLDLGIETCFYNGMDSYAKTWFQFLFPFYIWFILALIILASRYLTRVVNLFGKHSVEVL